MLHWSLNDAFEFAEMTKERGTTGLKMASMINIVPLLGRIDSLSRYITPRDITLGIAVADMEFFKKRPKDLPIGQIYNRYLNAFFPTPVAITTFQAIIFGCVNFIIISYYFYYIKLGHAEYV